MDNSKILPFPLSTLGISKSTDRVRGGAKSLYRALWIALTVVILGIYAAALPVYFDLLRTPAPDGGAGPFQLPASEAVVIQQWGFTMDQYALVVGGGRVLFALVMVAGGLIVFARRSDDRMALFTSLFMILFGTFVGDPVYIPQALVTVNPGWAPLLNMFFILLGMMLVLFLYLFPTGRFAPHWARWTGAIWVGVTLLPILFPGSPVDFLQNPALFGIVDLVGLGSGITAQVIRYRKFASPLERQQTKWFVYGLVLFGVMSIAPLSLRVIFPALNQPSPGHLVFNAYFEIIGIGGGLSLFGATLLISILRHRLWDIDFVINRSLVYGGLTVLLGGIFVAGFVAIQQAFSAITGQMFPPVALAASALVIGALFNPARKIIRHLVDRHLYGLAFDLDRIAKDGESTSPGALTGRTLGAYHIGEVLGAGGMGEVYRARQTGLNRDVAIKVLPGTLARQAEFRMRFEREARMVATLRHPNVVNVFDFGQLDKVTFMVMDLVEGVQLGQLLKQRGALALNEALPVLRNVAAALDYIHSQGLVHRDIKASNVMVTGLAGSDQPGAVLMDFGVARIIGGLTRLTHSGIVGTLDYIAPEQIRASAEVDQRADVYSLGVLAFEVLTGRLPFESDNPGSLVFAHLQQPAPDPRRYAAYLPPHVAQAILVALDKHPERRFRTAGDFAAALMASGPLA